ncbi:MAG TPA: 3-oxoacyl-ACP reductase family protein [Bryobacteraceae bacterium]|jgi:3-oxoacyl-[acyl-carrier protein] reductase
MMAQTALVTGASRGLGRAIALRLARDGVAVAVNYVAREDLAQELVSKIVAAGGRAIAVHADVGDAEQDRSMVERITADLGPISILVNNAGTVFRATLQEFDPAEMERMRRTNVDGLIQVTRLVAEGMKARGYGRIVNITSVAGHGTSLPGSTFYAATKAAVSMLTKRFAMELGQHGITVNAVAPGFILTDLVKVGRSGQEYEQLLERMRKNAMTGRVGKPEDIAHAVAFLAAEESSFITAQVLTVDGGRMDYIGHA